MGTRLPPSDLPGDGYAVRVVDYVTAGFGRGSREIKWYRRKGRQLAFAPTQKQVDRFREVSEPLIAAMGEALDDATEYGNARRGYAACALTDVLHAQFELALARFKAGELTTLPRWRTFSARCRSSAGRSPSWRTVSTQRCRS